MTDRTFYVPRQVDLQQIELPEELETKGRKGALHIRPSSTIFLTDDEAKFLEKNHLDFFKKLVETTPKKKEGKKSPLSYRDLEPNRTSFESPVASDSASSSGRKKKKSGGEGEL